MNGIDVSPSPNWYCNHVIDCNNESIIAYGTRGNVCLINCAKYPPKYIDLFTTHQERLTTLKFSTRDSYLLATGAEDAKAKIWNVLTKECLFCVTDLEALANKIPTMTKRPVVSMSCDVEECSNNNMQMNKKIVSIDWKTNSNSTVFIGSEKLGVLIWETTKKSVTTVKTGERSSVLLVKSYPLNTDWIGVGYKSGLIAIIDVNKNHIIKKFRGHDDNILSITWCPCYEEHEGNETVKYMASSSRDKTIRLWDIIEEKLDYVLTTPQIHKSGYHEESNRNRHWSSVVWCPNSKHTLISTSFIGEMLLWDLNKKGKKKWEVFKTGLIGGHNKCVFSIILIKPECHIACTISLDRQIAFWNIVEKRSMCVLPTIGGFTYALAFCPQEIGTLAVGAGDNTIRILNTAQPPVQSIGTFWQGIKGKVTTLAWHPTKEGLLAFGTEEGRLGVLDIMSNKPPTIFKSFHKDMVYRVGWGPNVQLAKKEDVTSELNLFFYSCGDYIINIHNPFNLNIHAVNFNNITDFANVSYKSLSRTDFAWKSDYSVIAIGNVDGSVEIFSGQNLQLLAQLVAQKKLINSLQWHPPCTVISKSQEQLHSWLACASNDAAINIYNLFPIINKSQDEVKEITIVTEPVRCLIGHQARVLCLSWSSHYEGRLASASYDNTVQVWDVLANKPLANYRGHQGRVYSVVWSLHNPDNCFSGGEDYAIHQWNATKQEHDLPPSKQATKQNKKKKKDQVELKEMSEEDKKIIQQMIEQKKELILNSLQEQQIMKDDKALLSTEEFLLKEDEFKDIVAEKDAEISENCSVTSASSIVNRNTTNKQKSGKPKTQKSLFPFSSTLENRGKQYNHEDCVFLMDHLSTEETNELMESSEKQAGEGDVTHLGLFSDRAAAWRMINTEANRHRKANYLDCALQLEIWKGNIGDALREAADKSMLNDNLVSLAPLGSRQLWLEMCKKYAEQLIANGIVTKAVLYLLACHDVYKAINTLREHGYYREALTLAKVRLPSSDPLIATILNEWTFKANKDSNFALSAKCYISLQQYSKACKQLANNTDPISMQTAAYISKKCNNHKEAQSYIVSCIKIALRKQEWETAKIAISQYPEIKSLMLVVSAHKFLCDNIEMLQSIAGSFGLLCSVIPRTDNDLSDVTIWKGGMLENIPFISRLVNYWISENLLKYTDDASTITNYYQTIESLMTTQQTSSSAKEFYPIMATELCLAVLAGWNYTNDETVKKTVLKHLNKLFASSNSSSLLNIICLLLFPVEIKWTSLDGIQIILAQHTSEYSVYLLEELNNQFQNFQSLICSNSAQNSSSSQKNATYEEKLNENEVYDRHHETKSFIIGYFCLNLLHSMNESFKNSSNTLDIFNCEIKSENKTPEKCANVTKLFSDLIRLFKSALLCETHAYFNTIHKRMIVLSQNLAIVRSNQLHGHKVDTKVMHLAPEIISNCADNASSLRNDCELSTEVCLKEENATSSQEETILALEEKQNDIIKKLQYFENLTNNHLFPNPVTSAEKIIFLCKEIISKCSCCHEPLNSFVEEINLWIQKFDTDEQVGF